MMARSSKVLVVILILVLLALAAVFAARNAGPFLRVNAPEHADVILVVAGGPDDSRFWRAVELMRAGYADKILLDAEAGGSKFGKTGAELAQDFLIRNNARNTTVCPVYEDSTYSEVAYTAKCLEPLKVSSVLMVTSDYHTRRALSIFRARLPRYRWSVASVYVPYTMPDGTQVITADKWWQNRRWAKTILDEWEKWLWWQLVDRWKSDLVLKS